jgi:putative acetyltransferase
MNIFQAQTDKHIHDIRILFREYETALGVDLCFQSFEEELANLPGKYAPPRGSLLLAEGDDGVAGCAAMRKIAEHFCEMKRLFVRPPYRGLGIGRMLAQEIICRARHSGYRIMYLDTLEILERAIALYKSLGFQETDPYYHNPLDGVVYLKLDLRT